MGRINSLSTVSLCLTLFSCSGYAPVETPLQLSYGPQRVLLVNAFTSFAPVTNCHSSNGCTFSCSVTPSLPQGLVLNTETCAISGKPTTLQSGQSYTVRAVRNDGQYIHANLSVAVEDIVGPRTQQFCHVSGTISDLTGTLQLSNSGYDTLSVASNGLFAFSMRLPLGTPYHVSIESQPSSQLCTVTNSNGVCIGRSASVDVSCQTLITPTISLSNMTAFVGDPAITVNATSNSSGALSYVSSDTCVATISGNQISPRSAGSSTITVNQSAFGDFGVGSTTATIQVYPNSCSTNPCQNGGGCSNVAPSGYNCSCVSGYTGTNCETAPDNCSPNPCQNGSSCTNNPPSSYTCSCTSGWTGQNCNVAIDECATMPCLNGGTCIRTFPTGYTCNCPAGFTGANCQTIDTTPNNCASNPCQNGGTCTNDPPSSYICSCPSGYSGVNCELSSFACEPGCGIGTCQPDSNGGSCTCPTCYLGDHCETFDVVNCA